MLRQEEGCSSAYSRLLLRVKVKGYFLGTWVLGIWYEVGGNKEDWLEETLLVSGHVLGGFAMNKYEKVSSKGLAMSTNFGLEV